MAIHFYFKQSNSATNPAAKLKRFPVLITPSSNVMLEKIKKKSMSTCLFKLPFLARGLWMTQSLKLFGTWLVYESKMWWKSACVEIVRSRECR